MEKNTIKNIIDSIRIVLLILVLIVFNLTDKIFFCLISLIPLIILEIIDRIFWRCKKCGKYLPHNSWFDAVICCPYCNTNINEK